VLIAQIPSSKGMKTPVFLIRWVAGYTWWMLALSKVTTLLGPGNNIVWYQMTMR